MAVHNKSELIDPRAVLPRTEAVIMVQRAVKQLSQSSQQPMVVLECKTLAPDVIDLPGDSGKAQVAGREFKHYVSFSPKAIFGSVEFYEKLSGDRVPEKFDDEVIQDALVAMEGKVFNGLVYSEPFYEQDANRKNIVGEDGKPILKGYSTRLADVRSVVRELTDPNPNA